MSGEEFVAASYRGLEVGERLKLFDFGPTTAHLELHQPLPNGTQLELATDAGHRIGVTVVRVHEQVGGSDAVPGMRVRADNLSGDVKVWWSKLVSTNDPQIPEPAMAARPAEEQPVAQEAAVDSTDDGAGDGDAIPDEIESQVTNPIESRNSTKRTQIMNVAEIQAAIGESEDGAPDADDSDGKTRQMSQEELQATLDKERAAAGTDDGDDSDSNGDSDANKKKKRRRRKGRTRR